MKLLSTLWFRRHQSSSALRFTRMCKIATRDHGGVMNRLLIVAILSICAVPVHVQAQHADLAKLKADAQRIVRVIGGDRAKTQAYCQIDSLGKQIDHAVRENDEQKAEALTRKINDLEKTLGPEYLAFFDALNNLDQNPKEFRDILPLFDTLNQSCPH
jgi:hypothetical protein